MADFIDARTLPEGQAIAADLIIIGGGMAGIAMAREFAGGATRVAVIESGGLDFDAAVQDLYAGQGVITGPEGQVRAIDDYPANSRMRMLGGSGNVWGGKCAPLDEADFTRRSWIPDSGWPVTRRSLSPYLDRACALLELPRFDGTGPQSPERPVLDIGGSREFFSAPRHFTRYSGGADKPTYDRYRTSLASAPNVAVYLHANVREIVLDKTTGQVARLDIACLNGRRHTAQAKRYVLATGGIENARLLLASTSVEADGVGNRAGLVGRYFQGHLTYMVFEGAGKANSLVAFTTAQPLSLYADTRGSHSVFASTLAGQSKHRTGNFTVTLTTAPSAGAPDAQGLAISRLGGLIDAGLDSPAPRSPCFFMTEHMPNPQSRVALGSTSDALGMARVRLEWAWSKADFDSLERSIEAFACALGAAGKGRVSWPVAREDLLAVANTSRHHMGTTRISRDPAKGVVDEDCRVHGVRNLYVAGSSVFPTSGIANPTLTLLAMAYRLTDHLKADAGAWA